ncbi:calcium-binding protein [Pseudomonas koreensis]|uniref:calcium-binding protein n=1 Tax=Pseudomonas koreensis TaxID=198620 RepID=UPI0021C73861|nr:calcium-binding protein [Pseudomonas koreensis]MCU0072213.1 calcium-binding protein [Pseudomonas koreensis]
MAIVNGTSEADVLIGTQDNDELYGMESDDQLLASGGSDVLDGGEGFDTATYYGMSSGVGVEVGAGAVTVTGADGKVDTLVSVEKVVGSFYNDTFTASVGGVTLDGSVGDDVYNVSAEGVTLIEENNGGYDELRTSLNTIKMDPFIEKLTFTGTGDFKGYGNASDNEIIGGAGNDWLWGGAGADHFVGGEGFDTVSYSDSLEGVRVLDFENYDALTIAAGDTFTGIEAIQGSSFDDVVYLLDNAMIVDGADGYDTVSYRHSWDGVKIGIGQHAGPDVTLLNVEKVIGTSFADQFTANVAGVTLEGGMGDDVYTINSTGVSIVETDFFGGIDHVYTSLSSLHMDPFIEKMTYTGTADFTGYGNDGDNVIVSGAGNDVLFGGAGADRFEGGAGVDTVSYEDSTEGLSVSLGWGPQSGIALYDMYIDIENLRGSHFNDVLQGDWGDNILEGGAGDDFIQGGGGADILYGGLASGLDGEAPQNDTLIGGDGDDTYVVNAPGLVAIQDLASSFNDTLIMNTIANLSQLSVTRVGDDAYLHGANDGSSGVPANGVKLVDWYVGGYNNIEHLQTADGQVYELPATIDGFAMFG